MNQVEIRLCSNVDRPSLDLESRIRTAIIEREAFLQPSYSLKQLSRETGYSTNVLSAFFNHNYRVHFRDYINQYRIGHCQYLIEQGAGRLFKLKALGLQCGFFNRNTFTTAFKKWTGITPSRFMRCCKKTG